MEKPWHTIGVRRSRTINKAAPVLYISNGDTYIADENKIRFVNPPAALPDVPEALERPLCPVNINH
jgi:hypothetical protein